MKLVLEKQFLALLSFLFPDGKYTKDELKEVLRYSISVRRRVKEQLKRMIGSEFDAVNLGFTDRETQETEIVHTKEQPKTSFMDEVNRVGKVFVAGSNENTALVGAYTIESKMIDGDGGFNYERFYGSKGTREVLNAAITYFGSNFTKISTSISLETKNYLMTFSDLSTNGATKDISMGLLVSLFSTALNKPVIDRLLVVGNFKLTGQMEEIRNVKEYFRVAMNSKAENLLLPKSAITQLQDASEYVTAVNIIFYDDPIDGVKKALNL